MIRQIRIRDFKSIRDVVLDLDEITVLVGPSGTGKSNLVQALRFLRNYLINPAEAVQYEGGWEQISPAGVDRPATSIELELELPGTQTQYTYVLRFGTPERFHGAFDIAVGQQAIWEESLAITGQTLFHRKRDLANPANPQWIWLTPPRVARVPASENVRALLGGFPELQDTFDIYAAISKGIGYYHLPSTVLSKHTKRNGSGQEILKELPGLHDDGENYLQAILALSEDFRRAQDRKAVTAALQAVNPTVMTVNPDSLTRPSVAWVGHETGGGAIRLKLEQESDGFRRFYVHLLALYQSPPKIAMVFEEPENAIFPGALSLLAEEFKAAPRENRGQVILTTHSPGLLDAIDVGNVRVVELHHGETKVGRVAPDQAEAVNERLMKTGELLTVVRPRMAGSPSEEVEASPA